MSEDEREFRRLEESNNLPRGTTPGQATLRRFLSGNHTPYDGTRTPVSFERIDPGEGSVFGRGVSPIQNFRFQNPTVDENISSLVFRDDNGGIQGLGSARESASRIRLRLLTDEGCDREKSGQTVDEERLRHQDEDGDQDRSARLPGDFRYLHSTSPQIQDLCDGVARSRGEANLWTLPANKDESGTHQKLQPFSPTRTRYVRRRGEDGDTR